MNPVSKRRLRVLIGAILTVVVCVIVGRTLVDQWDAIVAYDWQIKPLWLLASAIILWIDYVMLFHLWRLLLESVWGHRLSFPVTYRVSMLANLGKYIPGKVWTVAGVVYLLAEEDVPPGPALVSSALHQAFTLIPGAVFITYVLGVRIWGDFSVVAVTIGLAMGVLVLYPPIFRWCLNTGLRLIGRPTIDFKLSFVRAFTLFWVYIWAWVMYGASFWCMTLGLGLPAGPFWEVTAGYGAAYLVGFLALFAPGGLGVREGMLTVILAPYLPVGLAVAVAVVSRFWMTVVELAGLIPVAFGYGKRDQVPNPELQPSQKSAKDSP